MAYCCHQAVNWENSKEMELFFLRNIKKKLAETMKRKQGENRLVICSSIDRNLKSWETSSSLLDV